MSIKASALYQYLLPESKQNKTSITEDMQAETLNKDQLY